MTFTLDELIDIWQDALESAEPTDYEAKNLISEFLDHLNALSVEA